MLFTKGQLVAILGCSAATEAKWLDPINSACSKFNINTKLRLAAFIAQVGHESGRLATVTENLNYSADGLQKIWPSRFNDGNVDLYERKPEKIANKVYGGRMGNGPEASGDGWKYRGRGLIQCTGKSNYDAFSQACGVDAVSDPESLALPTNAALSAAWFWGSKGLNAYADRGDFLTITKRINGGIHGLKDREMLYKKALLVLSGKEVGSEDELAKKPVEVDPDVTQPISEQKTPAAQNSSIVEPRATSGETSKYPWNFVTESRSGHYTEIDDTPGNERISMTHRVGSYWEINSQGTITHKSVLDAYRLTKGDSYDYTGGNHTEQIKGQSFRQTSGNMIFKSGGDFFVNAPRIQFNTGMLAVSGEINSPNVNANLFSGMGGIAFGDMIAKEALVAYDIKKGAAPMLGNSLGFKGSEDAEGSADSLMSNTLSTKAPDGTPWTTNGVKTALAVAGAVAGTAAVVSELLKDNDPDEAISNAMTSAAADLDDQASKADSQTPVFLKHVTFDKPTLLSQSTIIDVPDPSLYVNNYHTIVDPNGVGQLHISNGTEWVPIWSKAQAYTDEQASGLQSQIDLEAQTRADAIAQEAQTRADEIAQEALARQQAIDAGLLNEAQQRQAAVTAEATARQTEDTSLSNRILTLTAAVDDNAAAIQQEQTARVDAISAEAAARETLAAKVDTNTASITTEQTARANADSALSTRIDSLSASTDSNFATVNTQITALTNEDTALSSRIDAVVAKADSNTAAITTEQTSRADADTALSTRIDAVLAKADNNTAAIVTEQTARADADGALSTRIDAVLAKADNNAAAITAEQTARADGDSANASSIETVRASATAAQNDATAALNEISNISSDNVLSKVEKSAVIKEYDTLVNEQTSIGNQATTFGVSKTNYDTAVNALKTYMTGLAPAYNDLTQNTTIVGTTFRQKFQDVYTARTNLLNSIDSQAKTLADNAQNSANAANSAIANITSDNVLAKGEKTFVILQYNSITGEQAGIDSQATTFGITTEKTAYDNAITALTTYLTGLGANNDWSNTSTDTTIVGTTFRQKFQDVYTAKQALLNAISAKAKALADAAQTTANSRATVFKQSLQPTAKAVNDIWIDIGNQNKMKVWDGTSWVDVSDTRIAQNSADIVTEQQARADGDSANANSITTLQTTVNGHTTSIQTNTSSIDGVKANYSVKINNNGVISGIGLLSDVYNGVPTSTFVVEANKFEIVSPGAAKSTSRSPFMVVNGVTYIDTAFINELNVNKITSGTMNAEWRLNGANARIVLDNGVVMKVIGTGFGANSDLIEWFGPSMAINQCTKSNATIYVGTDGSAYYGGSLSAGKLYNAQQTTQIAQDASVPLGPFYSNGNPRTIVVSYQFSHDMQSSSSNPGTFTADSTPTYADIQLLKGSTILSTTRINGNHFIDNGFSGDPGTASINISGSFTVTDTGPAGDYTYTAKIILRSLVNITNTGGTVTSSVVNQKLSISSTEE